MFKVLLVLQNQLLKGPLYHVNQRVEGSLIKGCPSCNHRFRCTQVTCTERNSELTFKWPPSAPVNATNIASYAELLVAFVRHRHPVYQTTAHLLVWGSDYLFTDADVMFANMEVIMDYINARPHTYNMSLRYTTLAQYADHIHSLGVGFRVKGHPLDFEYGCVCS